MVPTSDPFTLQTLQLDSWPAATRTPMTYMYSRVGGLQNNHTRDTSQEVDPLP